ncbi:MAG: helix-turn-helix domain-containing protein [Acidimicrobiia bacterium]
MTDRDRPRQLFSGPVVVVSGPAALALAAFLRRYQREWRELAPPYAQASIEVADTVAAICLVADMFKRRQLPEAALPPPEMHLPLSGMVTPEIAAGRLGLSERRIRQLLNGGRLPGHKVNGRWLVDAESLEK